MANKTEEINHVLVDELYELILNLQSKEDCEAFFEDLCTPRELEKMAQRIRAASLLKAGYTYNKVIEETDISSATLSRVSRCLKHGTGYKKMIK